MSLQKRCQPRCTRPHQTPPVVSHKSACGGTHLRLQMINQIIFFNGHRADISTHLNLGFVIKNARVEWIMYVPHPIYVRTCRRQRLFRARRSSLLNKEFTCACGTNSGGI